MSDWCPNPFKPWISAIRNPRECRDGEDSSGRPGNVGQCSGYLLHQALFSTKTKSDLTQVQGCMLPLNTEGPVGLAIAGLSSAVMKRSNASKEVVPTKLPSKLSLTFNCPWFSGPLPLA